MECVASGFPWEVSSDDLFVDQLLDFSNADQQDQLQPQLEETEQDKESIFSVCREEQTNDDSGSLPETELSLPATEGLESLEWLSNFVEDSFPDYSLAGKSAIAPPGIAAQEEQRGFITKARTKRARIEARVWPSFTTESSSSISTTTSFPSPKPCTVRSRSGEKKPVEDGQAARRCSHCGATKTPQWRAGPQGSKTLCNACGVRYKSGRLLPEYRPACSPTFSSERHSNSHRKVLEMRREKELELEASAAAVAAGSETWKN